MSSILPRPDWSRDIQKASVPLAQDAKRLMIENFVRVLFAPYESGHIELRCIMQPPGKDEPADRYKPPQQYWFKLPTDEDVIERIVRCAFRAECEGFDVYVGVLPRAHRKGDKESVTAGAVLWADIDFKRFPQATAAAKLKAMAPDMVVNSGNGYHAYWLLKDVVPIGDVGVKKFEAKVKAWQKQIGTIDNTADVPRILRLPGSTNYKDPLNPKPVRLLCPFPSLAMPCAGADDAH